ncbi:unnamed protein product [Cuscuta europaea]|uniref:Uncharacterized protein n=1 Tax=Cuscuta europaea TaxID=41803 RepID=A0A9P1EMY8_CUSEU|nr:unnamed protein product [Cuscuta europaea]
MHLLRSMRTSCDRCAPPAIDSPPTPTPPTLFCQPPLPRRCRRCPTRMPPPLPNEDSAGVAGKTAIAAKLSPRGVDIFSVAATSSRVARSARKEQRRRKEKRRGYESRGEEKRWRKLPWCRWRRADERPGRLHRK